MPYQDPPGVAGRRELLLADPALRRRLGAGLRQTVEARYSAIELARAWKQLFDEVVTEGPR